MMNDEVANSNQNDTTRSRSIIEVAVLMTAILATLCVGGGHITHGLTLLLLPAFASIAFALFLHSENKWPSTPSPTVRVLIHGLMLIILALSILVVRVRLVYPIASFPDALNNRLHRVLGEQGALLCFIHLAIAVVVLILSRAARLSPVFWLSIALALTLVST